MVAVKVLKVADPEMRLRFAREAKALAQLTHANTLIIHEFGETGDQPYIVSEYVDGETLANLIQRSGLLPLEGAMELEGALLAALDHAHGKGIVHRDVKPANILLPRSGGLKLADFGLAKGAESGSALGSLTAAGTIMGTPAYMAPEQVKGERPGPATDIYAAGVVAYEMLTGRVPFTAASDLEVMGMHVRQPPPDPRSLRSEIPESLARAVQKAMAKRPDDRWSSAAAFRTELAGVRGAPWPDLSAPAPATNVAPPATAASAHSDRPHAPAIDTLPTISSTAAASEIEPDPIERHLANLDAADPGVRRDAIFACAKAVEIRALPRLRAIAAQDHSIELRYLARKSLWLMSAQKPDCIGQELSSQATLNLILDPDSAVAIMRKLMSEKPQDRASALRAAATAGARQPQFLDVLVMRVEEEDVPSLRASLVTVLGALGSAKELPLIVRFLQEADPAIRGNAVQALEMLREPAAYAFIIRTLQDAHPSVRARAIEALHRLGKTNILRCCRAMLAAPEAWPREAAAFCLAASKYPESVSLFEMVLDDTSETVRTRARNGLRSLADSGDASAKVVLEKIVAAPAAPGDPATSASDDSDAPLPAADTEHIASHDVHERRRATRKVSILGADESQIPELAKRLDNESDDETVVTLLAALGRSRRAAAVPAIVSQLTHASASVRVAAVSALVDLGDPAHFGQLIPLLSDASLDVASKTILTLERHHTPESLAALRRLAGSPDRTHRRAAVLVASEMEEPEARSVLDRLAKDSDEDVARVAREAHDMDVIAPAVNSARRRIEPAPAGTGSSRGTGSARAIQGGPVSRMSGAWKLPTQKTAALSPPRTGVAALLSGSPALTAALAVSALTVGGIAVAMMRHPDASPSSSKSQKAGIVQVTELSAVLASTDVARIVGRLVRWQGSVKEVGGERDRLLVESGGNYFAVRCDSPVGAEVTQGSRVEVEGVVIERTQGVVVLQGRDVRIAAGPTPGASARR